MVDDDEGTGKRTPWILESLRNHNVFKLLSSHWWVDGAVWIALTPGVFNYVYKLVKPDHAVARTSQWFRIAGSRSSSLLCLVSLEKRLHVLVCLLLYQ